MSWRPVDLRGQLADIELDQRAARDRLIAVVGERAPVDPALLGVDDQQLLDVVSHTPPETERLGAWLDTGFLDVARYFVTAS